MRKNILLNISLGIVIVFFTIKYLPGSSFSANLPPELFVWIFSFLFFVFSMFMRSVRTYYLIYDYLGGFREIIRFQFISACLQILLPFKVGDGMRVYLFKNLTNGIFNSFFIYMIEKVYDILSLGLIILYALFFGGYSYYSIISFPFPFLVTISLLIFFGMPDIANIYYKGLLCSPSLSKAKIRILKILYSVLYSRKSILITLKGKYFNIFVLSLSIWLSEALSFWFIIRQVGLKSSSVLISSPLVALSSFLPSPPLGIAGSVNVGMYWSSKILNASSLYTFSAQYSIFILGLFCLIVLLVYFTYFKQFILSLFKINKYFHEH